MYDIIIIGKGPAGISAALYTLRAGYRTLIIAKDRGNLGKAEKIQNYYGLESNPTGKELLEAGVRQAKALGAEIIDDEVVGLSGYESIEVKCKKGTYTGKALILAMGSPKRKFPAENIEKYEGAGISYCAVCDGFFYKGKKIALIGYTGYMAHEARELKDITDNLTIITNGRELEMSDEERDMIKGIKVSKGEVKGFYGDDVVGGIEFQSGEKEDFDGVFIAYGSASAMEMAMKTGLLTEKGAIVVDCDQRTNLPHVFAAGDCTGGFKQIAVAVGGGAVAAKSAMEYLRTLK
jgi:thioredoxin reductase (NADPH)